MQKQEDIIEKASLDKAFGYVVRYFIRNVIPKVSFVIFNISPQSVPTIFHPHLINQFKKLSILKHDSLKNSNTSF